MKIPRENLIKIAEEVGILVNNSDFPYTLPAQQRLISRLEKFAIRVEKEVEEKNIRSEEALQKISDLTKDIGQEL